MHRILSSFGLVFALCSISFAQTQEQHNVRNDVYDFQPYVWGVYGDVYSLEDYVDSENTLASGERASAVIRGATILDLMLGDLYYNAGVYYEFAGEDQFAAGMNHWNTAATLVEDAQGHWDGGDYAQATTLFQAALDALHDALDRYNDALSDLWDAQLSYVDAYYLYSQYQ